MTQDHYGQVRGDVPDDETDDYPSDQPKPMTRFQKVASALRGDRPEDSDDSDETDQDEVPGGRLDPNYETTTGSGSDAYPDMATDPDAVTDPNGITDPGHGGVSDVTTNPDTTSTIHQGQPGHSVWGSQSEQAGNGQADAGQADTATEAQRGDYWEVPDDRGDQVAAVTSPDTPVADTGTNPLPNQDETRPDIPEAYEAHEARGTEPDAYAPSGTDDAATDTAPAGYAAADTVPAGTVAGDTVPADDAGDAGGAGSGAATIADGPLEQEGTVAQDTAAQDTVAQDTAAQDTVAGDAAAQDAGVTGRHAAASRAQEDLRPGEAAGDLDDLGDLAYGKLVPDAAKFTEQWQQIQFRFVDDPHGSVTEAAEVVSQVTAKLEAAIQERLQAIQARQNAIQERQRSLRDRWGEGTQADTETLRETLRMYRAFLDQLIGPKG